jgi:hypothetical protein
MTLIEALVALDRAITAAGQSSARDTQLRQSWTAAEDAMERFSDGRETYCLSDGGYSQLAYSIRDRWCLLSRSSTERVRDRFESALPERRAIETLIAEWLEGRRPNREP